MTRIQAIITARSDTQDAADVLLLAQQDRLPSHMSAVLIAQAMQSLTAALNALTEMREAELGITPATLRAVI